jgi:small subunit ribosomal protein S7
MCFKYTLISFVKILQKKGLKELAELTIKESLSILKKDIKKHPLIIFVLSLTKLKPFCQIKSIKISGNIYKIPVEITKNKQQTIILKWIIFNVLQNSKLSLKKKITKEIIDSLYSISKTTKMCDDFHKIAESNKLNILSK